MRFFVVCAGKYEIRLKNLKHRAIYDIIKMIKGSGCPETTYYGVNSMKKILFILVVIFFVLFLFATLIWLESYGIFENYIGWRRLEVPTETESKAEVRLPKDWNFVVENGLIYIKDNDDNIIATEIYEDYREKYTSDGIKYDNIDEIEINSEYHNFFTEYKEQEKLCDNDGPCAVYRYVSDDLDEVYVMVIPVYVSKNRNYELVLAFEDGYCDTSVFKKIVKSHRYRKYAR